MDDLLGLSSETGLEMAVVGFHWMHSSDPGDASAKPYDNSFALTGEFKQGRWAAISDVLYATGAAVPDVWGISVIPTYHLTDKLQTHYELTAPDLVTLSGDLYQAGLAGLNYYLCGQKLKLMTGIESSNMRDDSTAGGGYDGWTWMSGFRLFY